MRRFDKTYRLVKIGKIAASVAVCGFTLSLSNFVSASYYNVDDSVSSFTEAVDTNRVEFFYNTGGGGNSSNTHTVTVVLEESVDITGYTGVGSIDLGIYSRDTSDGSAVDTFWLNDDSVLNLRGDNTINGDVGVHVDINGVVTIDGFETVNITGDAKFYDSVYSNLIEITDGSTVEFYGMVSDGTDGTNNNYGTAIDLNGNDATIIMHDNARLITQEGLYNSTGIYNGTLIFTGSSNGTIGSVGASYSSFVSANGPDAAISDIILQGSGDVVTINYLSADLISYEATSTLTVNNDIWLSLDTSSGASNVIEFNNSDGTLNVGGDVLGDITKDVITTTDGRSTVNLTGGTQAVVGNIGNVTNSLGNLNIGTASSSTTTVSGNMYVQSTTLDNDSTLILDEFNGEGSGYHLTGDVLTDVDGLGTLKLAGGEQTIDGQIGTAGTSGKGLKLVESGANIGDFSTFKGAVYALDVTVGAGETTFETDLGDTVDRLTDVTIGSGTANFNTVSGDTYADIIFSGAGTANLHEGITGNIDFITGSTVNLFEDKIIDGNITADSDSDGTLNIKGNGRVTGTVGTGTFGSPTSAIGALNLNTDDAAQDDSNAVFEFSVGGDVYADVITLNNGATFTLDDGVDVTGNIVSYVDSSLAPVAEDLEADPVVVAATGDEYTQNILNILGSSQISGYVGTTTETTPVVNPLDEIRAGAGTSSSLFQDGVVYADLLNYQNGGGEVTFNGTGSAGSLGFVGTVDFDPDVDGEANPDNIGTAGAMLSLGDNVDLYTQNSVDTDGDATTDLYASMRTTFLNANAATLTFDGSSTIYGKLGAAAVDGAEDTQTFAEIYAGAAGEVVNFTDDVYVTQDTFYVSGTGTVNFSGDLNGPLVYKADGHVNVADEKVITGTVTTDSDNQGTLSFVGSTTLNASIGSAAKSLLAVNFHEHADHTDGSVALDVLEGPATVNIGYDVYAATTTIGNSIDNTAVSTTANITQDIYLGDNLTLVEHANAGGVTLNTFSTTGLYEDGRILQDDEVFDITIAGNLSLGNGTVKFAVNNADWTGGAGGLIINEISDDSNTADVFERNSSTISGVSTLDFDGTEDIVVALAGSLRHNQTISLIEATSVTGLSSDAVTRSGELAGMLSDNSFVIDSTLTVGASGAANENDLVVTFTRADNEYITKSDTLGHFSNTAATRLGTLAAAGSDYTADFQKALNMLDVDEWGYGDSEENLAEQMKWLAPIANNSLNLSAFQTASVVNDSLGQRMHELRLPESGTNPAGWWVGSAFDIAQTDQIGDYNGYDSNVSAATIGVDKRLSDDSILGAAVSFSNTSVDQDGYRNGDEAGITGTHLSLYGAFDVTPEFFVGATLTGAQLDTDSNRSTIVGRIANASYDSTQVTGKIDLGYRIKLGNSNVTLTPLAHYEHSTLKQDAYTETGAGDVGYNVEAETFKRNEAGLGFRLAGVGSMGGVVVKPELTLLSTTIGGNFSQDVRTSFIGDNTTSADFVTTALDENSYDSQGYKATLGMGLLMSDTSSIDFRVEHSEYDDRTNSQIDLKARWEF